MSLHETYSLTCDGCGMGLEGAGVTPDDARKTAADRCWSYTFADGDLCYRCTSKRFNERVRTALADGAALSKEGA